MPISQARPLDGGQAADDRSDRAVLGGSLACSREAPGIFGGLGSVRLLLARPGGAGPVPAVALSLTTGCRPESPRAQCPPSAAVAVAVPRYRLYDIYRVISRTLAYAIITGVLAGVYAGLVLLTGTSGPRHPRYLQPGRSVAPRPAHNARNKPTGTSGQAGQQ